MKVVRSLWDTGASVSLISARVAKVLGLVSIGKSGVSGYNDGIDVKDTYCVHVGLPTGDVPFQPSACSLKSHRTSSRLHSLSYTERTVQTHTLNGLKATSAT